jgi:hypothetical protein
MIQLNTTSLFGPPDSSDSILAPPANQASTGFQSDLSAALDATLKNFGIDPSKVTVSIAPAVATPKAATGTAEPAAPKESFDDAYWAKQPPAVQALRGIDDYDQRMQMVSQLAAHGYNIDVPIMAWGWDPAKVTAARQSYGYTWVPSATQNPIAEAPGVSLPGVKAYDPKNPPAGSIAV